MDQQHLDFNDEQPSSHDVNLDQEQLHLLRELMADIVIHVFYSQEHKINEHTQKNHQD